MRGIKITRYGARPFRLTTVKPGNGIGIMYLRELSKAEAPQDRLLDTTSFVAFTRDSGGGQQNWRIVFVLMVGAIYRIARF